MADTTKIRPLAFDIDDYPRGRSKWKGPSKGWRVNSSAPDEHPFASFPSPDSPTASPSRPRAGRKPLARLA